MDPAPAFLRTVRLAATVFLLALAFPGLVRGQDRGAPAFVPDPDATVTIGPAYRYPQAGWIVVHIEGAPYERGYQHGSLLAREIVAYLRTLAREQSPKDPEAAWKARRTLVNALFLRGYDREWLDEMKGIADGAADHGAAWDGRPLDLLDVVSLNSEIEASCLEGALEATATGLEGAAQARPVYARPTPKASGHCSAFAATAPATPDGKVVIGHITMWSLNPAHHMNVWLDVKPADGHRIVMQTYPGGIQSGMDWYQNDAGLVVTETTIGATDFEPKSKPLAGRIRKALQYSDDIDGAIAALLAGNNGLYTNEWLLADTKTGEIAMFELGTHKSRLWRSTKGEWFGGTEGFYWGCNNEKDLDVRLETIPGTAGRPAGLVWKPSDRDRAWQTLFRKQRGRIGEAFGFEAFTTPPLSAAPSLDAKFTTTAMAAELKCHALFGPPMGRAWEPSPENLERDPAARPLVANDWTVLGAGVPPDGKDSAAALSGSASDLGFSLSGKGLFDVPIESPGPAWSGTLLPATDADAWLASASAEAERVVAWARTGERGGPGGLAWQSHVEAAARESAALFPIVARYAHAVRRLGLDPPLARLRADTESDEWHDIATGKGVLFLLALRRELGPESFDAAIAAFGGKHAGKPVTTAAFRSVLEEAAGRDLGTLFTAWTETAGCPAPPPASLWSHDSWTREPEETLIVQGTLRDREGQREAAELLRKGFAAAWSNVDLRIVLDREATDEDLKSHHLLIVGRPGTNVVADRMQGVFPVRFGSASFRPGFIGSSSGKIHAHPRSAIVAAGANPLEGRYSAVLVAGLSAAATRDVAWRWATGALTREPGDLVVAAADRPVEVLVVSSLSLAAPVSPK